MTDLEILHELLNQLFDLLESFSTTDCAPVMEDIIEKIAEKREHIANAIKMLVLHP